MSAITLSIEAVIENAIERAFQKHFDRWLAAAKPQLEDQDPIFTRREMAKYIGVAEITLAVWASQKRGPRMLKLGRMVRYRKSHADEFMQANLGLVGRKGRPPKQLIEVSTSGRVGGSGIRRKSALVG